MKWPEARKKLIYIMYFYKKWRVRVPPAARNFFLGTRRKVGGGGRGHVQRLSNLLMVFVYREGKGYKTY